MKAFPIIVFVVVTVIFLTAMGLKALNGVQGYMDAAQKSHQQLLDANI